ncbi:MAG TPA: ornithine cyclodeaminase family protein [Edaphobacter sp.]|nr:ornithine cyclodeaminase family protein [Edaphobacter sp.]
MLHFTEEDVRRMLPMDEAIRCMREVFTALGKGEAQNQPRRRLALPTGSMLHSMAGSFGKYFGTKIYSTNPKHGAWFTFLLYDAETATPLAEFEANYLGQIRTGAAGGLATDLLTHPLAGKVGIIGSGFQAETQLAAVRAVREVRSVKVWSRSEEKRNQFAQANDAVATRYAEEAVEDADIVITATSSKDPVLQSEWISRPVFISAMGANHANRRELPSDLVRSADRIVVDSLEQARLEAGDLVLALDAREWNKVTELATVALHGKSPVTGLTIFKSIGLGVEDVAVAASIYERYS